MKKFLLASCALAACMGASAQKLQKAPVSFNELKLSSLTAAKFEGVSKKSPATKKVDVKNFIGLFVNNAWDEENEINNSTVDTMFTANAADEAGNTLNVKWNVAGNQLGYVYGYLDEKTNSFIVPQQYTNDGAPFDFGGQAGQSPVLFTGVSTNDKFCNFVASYNPETGQIVPNDTVAGYYFIITVGDYQNAWVLRNVSPTIARANAVETGYITGKNAEGKDDWLEFEQPVWLDYSAATDGVVDIYNQLLKLGVNYGCKFSVDVDGESASMATGQAMNYITDENAHETYGKYVLLRGVSVADGRISTDMNMATIEGGSYVGGEVAFRDIYFRGLSNLDSQQTGYGTEFFYNCTYTPTTTGIAGVTVKTTKPADNRIFNLAGQQVGKDYKGIVIQNGVKKLQK